MRMSIFWRDAASFLIPEESFRSICVLSIALTVLIGIILSFRYQSLQNQCAVRMCLPKQGRELLNRSASCSKLPNKYINTYCYGHREKILKKLRINEEVPVDSISTIWCRSQHQEEVIIHALMILSSQCSFSSVVKLIESKLICSDYRFMAVLKNRKRSKTRRRDYYGDDHRWVWRGAPFFQIENHVEEYRSPATHVTLQEFVSSIFCSPLSKNHPPWKIIAVTNYQAETASQKQTVLIFRFHHALADGISILRCAMAHLITDENGKEKDRTCSLMHKKNTPTIPSDEHNNNSDQCSCSSPQLLSSSGEAEQEDEDISTMLSAAEQIPRRRSYNDIKNRGVDQRSKSSSNVSGTDTSNYTLVNKNQRVLSTDSEEFLNAKDDISPTVSTSCDTTTMTGLITNFLNSPLTEPFFVKTENKLDRSHTIYRDSHNCNNQSDHCFTLNHRCRHGLTTKLTKQDFNDQRRPALIPPPKIKSTSLPSFFSSFLIYSTHFVFKMLMYYTPAFYYSLKYTIKKFKKIFFYFYKVIIYDPLLLLQLGKLLAKLSVWPADLSSVFKRSDNLTPIIPRVCCWKNGTVSVSALRNLTQPLDFTVGEILISAISSAIANMQKAMVADSVTQQQYSAVSSFNKIDNIKAMVWMYVRNLDSHYLFKKIKTAGNLGNDSLGGLLITLPIKAHSASNNFIKFACRKCSYISKTLFNGFFTQKGFVFKTYECIMGNNGVSLPQKRFNKDEKNDSKSVKRLSTNDLKNEKLHVSWAQSKLSKITCEDYERLRKLQSVSTALQYAKDTREHVSMNIAFRLLSFLPSESLFKTFWNLASGKASISISSLQGPTNINYLIFTQCQIEDIVFLSPPQGTTGITIGSFTYNDKFNLSLVVDSRILNRQQCEHFLKLIDEELNALMLLLLKIVEQKKTTIQQSDVE